MPSIDIVTEVPGPLSRALVERRAAAMSRGAAHLTDLGIASGDGAVVTDLDGNRLLDFVGGVGVLATGHCPPEVVAALDDQIDEALAVLAASVDAVAAERSAA